MHASAVKRIASIGGAFLGIIAIAVKLALCIGIATLNRRIEASAVGRIANVARTHVAVVAVAVDRAFGRQVAVRQSLVQASAGVTVANFKGTSVFVVAIGVDLARAAAALHDLVIADAVLRLASVGGASIAVAAVRCFSYAFASGARVSRRTRHAVRASAAIDRGHQALAIGALVGCAHIVVVAGGVRGAACVASRDGRELASAGLAAAGAAAALVVASVVGARVVVVANHGFAGARAVGAHVIGRASDVVIASDVAGSRRIEALTASHVATV